MKTCVLIEDSDTDRWNKIKSATDLSGWNFWPPNPDFKEHLLDVDTWLPLICKSSSSIFLDLQIGKDGANVKVGGKDVETIINNIKKNIIYQNYNLSKYEKQVSRCEWNYQIAAWVVIIAKENNVDIKFTTSYNANPVLECLGMMGMQPPVMLSNIDVDTVLKELKRQENTLERFWTNTSELTHDDIKNGRADRALQEFIGIEEDIESIIGLSDNDVHECLKTMCGKLSCFEDSDYSLSLLGGYFLFLGAVAHKTQKQPDTRIISIKDVDGIRLSKKILPCQSRELARVTAMAMFQMFCEFIIYEKGHSMADQLMIQRSCVSREAIEIELAFDVRKNWKYDRPHLAQGCAKALKNKLDEEPFRESEVGQTSQIILKYWLMSNIKDKGSYTDGIVFPASGGLELQSSGNKTVLRIRSCPIS